METFRLITLDDPCLIETSTGDKVLRPGKQLALVSYLAFARAHSATRDELLNLLWADVVPDRGRRTLRQTLWQIRQAIGESQISAGDGHTITLLEGVASDRADFLRAVDAADWELAMRLHERPFLRGFSLPGGAVFEQWADNERERLSGGFLHAAGQLIAREWQAGRSAAAIAVAQRCRSVLPDRPEAWSLYMEALAAAERTQQIALELHGFQKVLEASGVFSNPEYREVFERLSRRSAKRAPPQSEVTALHPEMVGREKQFAVLVQGARSAIEGKGSHVHVVGVAGIGKTRLLAELGKRARAMGLRTVSLSSTSADPLIEGGFLAQLVAALAKIPGARGVSSETASTLSELNPSVAALFGAQAVRGWDSPLRFQAEAIYELLESVADERPLALLLDNMQWLDVRSRSVIESLSVRLAVCPILLATSARPPSPFAPNADHRVALDTLSPEMTESLLASIAALPAVDWVRDAVREIHRSSGGSPLLILDILRTAMRTDLLTVVGESWFVPDPGALLASLAQSKAISDRLITLPELAREVGGVLAVGAKEVSWSDLPLLVPAKTGARDLAIMRLTEEGLVEQGEHGPVLAHELYREALLQVLPPSLVADVSRRVGLTLLARPVISEASLVRAAQLLVAGGASNELERVFWRWTAKRRTASDRRPMRQLVETFIATAGVPPELQHFSRRNRARVLYFAAAFALIALIPIFVWVRAHSSVAGGFPRALRLETGPVAGSESSLYPTPVIEAIDALGKQVDSATMMVSASAVPAGMRLTGDSDRPMSGGRVAFGSLGLASGPSQIGRIRFSARGLAPVETGPIYLGDEVPRHSWLKLARLSINGTAVNPVSPTFSLRPGQRANVSATLHYASYWVAASMLLGATVTWGDPRARFWDLGALVTPVLDGERAVSLSFTAPAKPGRYYLAFAFQAEGAVSNIMSGTNWSYRNDVWGDGNDVASYPDSVFERGIAEGRIAHRILRSKGGYTQSWLPMTAVRLRVGQAY